MGSALEAEQCESGTLGLPALLHRQAACRGAQQSHWRVRFLLLPVSAEATTDIRHDHVAPLNAFADGEHALRLFPAAPRREC